MKLSLFSGGAAQAVVEGLQADFEKATGCTLVPTFGAVGTMRDKLLAGDSCDLVILSSSLIEQLERQGRVVAGSARALGRVATGVAVRAGTPAVAIDSGDALKATFGACRGLYVPNLTKSTAGIHIAGILEKLGLEQALVGRIHEYPNGAEAMRALSQTTGDGMIGCTQVTEIMHGAGLTLIGELPAGYGLSTVYSAALCSHAADPGLASRFIETLGGAASRPVRIQAGFDLSEST